MSGRLGCRNDVFSIVPSPLRSLFHCIAHFVIPSATTVAPLMGPVAVVAVAGSAKRLEHAMRFVRADRICRPSKGRFAYATAGRGAADNRACPSVPAVAVGHSLSSVPHARHLILLQIDTTFRRRTHTHRPNVRILAHTATHMPVWAVAVVASLARAIHFAMRVSPDRIPRNHTQILIR